MKILFSRENFLAKPDSEQIKQLIDVIDRFLFKAEMRGAKW